MVTLHESLWPAILPFLAFAGTLWLPQRSKLAPWISIAAVTVSLFISFHLLGPILHGKIVFFSTPWLNTGLFQFPFATWLNKDSARLLILVLIVSIFVFTYSASYMKDDARKSLYFSYLSLFLSAMALLSMAENLLVFFMAWEIMGLCSYFLIGFWYEKEAARKAAQKAFLVTRLGDLGLLAGILATAWTFGTLSFSELPTQIATRAVPPQLLFVICLLLFCGAVGKSGQMPLHIWLPDAMQGPTPVSALIHAATMVAAGIFLLIRIFPLFQASPAAMHLLSIIGLMTTLFAAGMASSEFDLKRILAYSTISQLGLMVFALGVGSAEGSSFHLMTHGFSKALLFLTAGIMIHLSHQQDIRVISLKSKSGKVSLFLFALGALSLAGIPPLGCFWSKEMILSASMKASSLFYFLLLFSFTLTGFYLTRVLFYLLQSPVTEKNVLIAKKEWFSVICLAFISSVPLWSNLFFENAFETHLQPMISSLACTIAGALGMIILSKRRCMSSASLKSPFIFIQIQIFDRLEFYASCFSAKKAKWISLLDIYFLDAIVTFFAYVFQWGGDRARRWQTGSPAVYIISLLCFLTVVFILMGMRL